MRFMASVARLLSLLLLLTWPVAGCSVSFKFGKAPRAPTGPTTTEACVWNHSMVLRPAWSSAQSERNPDVEVNRARKSRAWIVYRGGQRIQAADALARLGDAQLSKAYRRIWTATARRGRTRVLASSTTLAAAVILGLAGGGMVHDFSAPNFSSMTTAGQARIVTGFVFIGVAVLSSVILPMVMRVGYRDVRAGEAFRTLFISKQHEPALRAAVARYNNRVRQACQDRVNAGQ
jgi:hypothetical protein